MSIKQRARVRSGMGIKSSYLYFESVQKNDEKQIWSP